MNPTISPPASLEILSLAGQTGEKEKVEFSYVPSLDGLRAVAVLMVVFFHAILVFPAFQTGFSGGFLGVDVFFVLSGFLITSILLKEFDKTQNINLPNFYLRRFLRLMPAYWFHLAVLFFLGRFLFSSSEVELLNSHQNFLYAFFYLTNWQRALNGSEITGLLSHTWSLAIEEQFYLVWAGCLLLMLRRFGRKTIVSITGGLIIVTAFFRAIQYQGEGSVDFLYNAFNSRMDALLIGCLVGQFLSWWKLPERFLNSRGFDLAALISVLVSVSVFFNLPASYKTPLLYQGGLTIFAVSVGFLLIWLIKRPKNRIHKLLETSPFIWVGKTSYGLYLWHSAAIAFVQFSPFPPVFKLISALILAGSITAVSYFAIELPFLKLKEKFK
ncbi:MAG: acyltransferase [Pyrinomonadaceae bacterium]